MPHPRLNGSGTAPTATVTSGATVGGHIRHGLYNFSVFSRPHGLDVYLQVDVVSAVKQIQ